MGTFQQNRLHYCPSASLPVVTSCLRGVLSHFYGAFVHSDAPVVRLSLRQRLIKDSRVEIGHFGGYVSGGEVLWIQKQMQRKVQNDRILTFAIATWGKNEWSRAEREPTVSVKSASQKLNIDSSSGDSALKS